MRYPDTRQPLMGQAGSRPPDMIYSGGASERSLLSLTQSPVSESPAPGSRLAPVVAVRSAKARNRQGVSPPTVPAPVSDTPSQSSSAPASVHSNSGYGAFRKERALEVANGRSSRDIQIAHPISPVRRQHEDGGVRLEIAPTGEETLSEIEVPPAYATYSSSDSRVILAT